jgi:hypothetical protein
MIQEDQPSSCAQNITILVMIFCASLYHFCVGVQVWGSVIHGQTVLQEYKK